jgi:DNA-binding NtrC family response regulator
MPTPRDRAIQRSPLRHPPRVLVVDEDSADRDYYRSLLEKQGNEVMTCPSFGDAMKHLLSETFDFAVIDQGSDRFEWRAVVEHALSPDHRTPVVVLARCHDMARYLEAMQLGVVDYLEKPLTASQLLQVVKTHLPSRAAAA